LRGKESLVSSHDQEEAEKGGIKFLFLRIRKKERNVKTLGTFFEKEVLARERRRRLGRSAVGLERTRSCQNPEEERGKQFRGFPYDKGGVGGGLFPLTERKE